MKELSIFNVFSYIFASNILFTAGQTRTNDPCDSASSPPVQLMSVFSMDDLLLRFVVQRNPAERFRIGATPAPGGRSGQHRPERAVSAERDHAFRLMNLGREERNRGLFSFTCWCLSLHYATARALVWL